MNYIRNYSAKDTNKVQSTIIVSKEYVPIWTITREILHDVVEDVLKRIAKKKAPPKKTKAQVVKKPNSKQVKPAGNNVELCRLILLLREMMNGANVVV